MRRVLVILGLVSTILASITCSSDDPAAPEQEPVTEASRTIPPAGGSVSVVAESGTRLTVSLPPGAVLAATRVSLRAVPAPSGVRARFAIEPSGLDLLEPATLTLTFPEGADVTPSLGFSFERSERTPIPTEVDVDARTLRASTFHLGFGDFAAVPGAAGPATAAQDSDEFINVEQLQCQLLEESLTDAILRAQAFVGLFPPDLASPLIQEYRAAVLACGAAALGEQEAAMRALACSRVESATLNSQVLLVETAQQLKESLGFLIAAEGIVQAAGADCAIESSTLEAEFDEFLQGYIARINDPGFTADFPTWDALWRELRTCLEIAAMSQEFAVPQAETTILGQLFPALFARLREVAASACDDDENNSLYLDLLTGGHTLAHPVTPFPEMPGFSGLAQDEVVDEMHRCGSSVLAEARTAQNEALDSSAIALSGGTGSVRVTDGGKIVLTSDVLPFNCGGIISRPPLRVRAELPNTLPVVQLGTLSGTMTVNVASTLDALPQPGDEPARDFDIVIERDRSVCGIDAAGTIELCRISVNTEGFEGAMAGSWSGACEQGGVSGTFQITVARDGTVTGTYGGSATGTIAGTVTANGAFDATGNGSAGPCTWSGSLSISGGALSGSGSWTCQTCSGSWSGP